MCGRVFQTKRVWSLVNAPTLQKPQKLNRLRSQLKPGLRALGFRFREARHFPLLKYSSYAVAAVSRVLIIDVRLEFNRAPSFTFLITQRFYLFIYLFHFNQPASSELEGKRQRLGRHLSRRGTREIKPPPPQVNALLVKVLCISESSSHCFFCSDGKRRDCPGGCVPACSKYLFSFSNCPVTIWDQALIYVEG